MQNHVGFQLVPNGPTLDHACPGWTKLAPSSPKLAQGSPSWHQVNPNWVSCWIHVAPTWGKLSPTWIQVGPKLAHVGRSWSKWVHIGPKLAPRWQNSSMSKASTKALPLRSGFPRCPRRLCLKGSNVCLFVRTVPSSCFRSQRLFLFGASFSLPCHGSSFKTMYSKVPLK